MKNWELVTTILAVVVVAGTVFYACKKDGTKELAGITEYQANDEKLTLNESNLKAITNSDFVSKILNATNIAEILFEKETNGKVSFRDGKSCDFAVFESDRIVLLNFEENHYQLSFQEDKLTLKNLTDRKGREYFEINDITENIDKAITTSVAIMVYLQEIGNFNYKETEEPMYAIKNYWCIEWRRSNCSEERMEKKLETYCDGKPGRVGKTDCFCLFGDFTCACLTEFECL